MPNLRDMIDGRTVTAAGIAPPMSPAAPPPGNAGQPKGKLPQPGQNGKSMKPGNGKPGKNGKSQGSPLANHVANHMQDPLGATQQGFQDLTQKKLDYDNARENMQRNLAPVQSVMDHVSQIHGIVPGTPAGQVPTPGMTPAQQPGQVDPMTGMPMDPNQDPNNPGMHDNPDMDPVSGNPANMSQTPGKMNQNRPSMAGHQPGVSPGPSENVRPGKMGMPQPGGMPQNNKTAAKPKGAGSIPGAKGPGDPKVAGKTKKAQGESSRAIKINVAASTSCSSRIPVITASRTLETQFGLATLLAGGPGSGRKPNFMSGNKTDAKTLDHLHQTLTNRGYQFSHSYGDVRENGLVTHVYYKGDPKDSLGRQSAHIYERSSGRHTTDVGHLPQMKAAGTTVGAKKNWSVRNKGHVSGKEKKAHFGTMESIGMMPSGGRSGAMPARPGGFGGGGGRGMPARGGPARPSGGSMFGKKMKAGPEALNDKVSDPGAEVAYNPKYQAACMKCGKKHAKNMECYSYA